MPLCNQGPDAAAQAEQISSVPPESQKGLEPLLRLAAAAGRGAQVAGTTGVASPPLALQGAPVGGQGAVASDASAPSQVYLQLLQSPGFLAMLQSPVGQQMLQQASGQLPPSGIGEAVLSVGPWHCQHRRKRRQTPKHRAPGAYISNLAFRAQMLCF
jgi:hypothetical protein